MNTKIILGIGTSVLLASSLLAFSPQSGMKQGDGQNCKQNKMMKSQKQGKKNGVVKMFMKLDLSDAQRTQIKSIIKDSMKNRPNPHTAFTDSSFNKEQFIKLAKEKRDNRVERKAQMIEKVYNVLTDTQKKDFKTMLDMRDMMMKKGPQMKNCAK